MASQNLSIEKRISLTYEEKTQRHTLTVDTNEGQIVRHRYKGGSKFYSLYFCYRGVRYGVAMYTLDKLIKKKYDLIKWLHNPDIYRAETRLYTLGNGDVYIWVSGINNIREEFRP
jgi:hypothetical protein